MERNSPLVHIGITVTDIDTYIDFYTKYFGFELKRRGVFPSDFIAAVPQLYRQRQGAYSDFAFLFSPNGIALELFQFNEIMDAEQPVWNKPGYHHICLMVENLQKTYERMAAEGVEFYFEPKPMGENSGAHWVFLKDPDGNMIELQDSNS